MRTSIFYLLFFLSVVSCSTVQHEVYDMQVPSPEPPIHLTQMSCINILDRNGFSETISTPDRLEKYEKIDFLQQQPYEKVLRVYKRDSIGDIRAFITSYHPNGNIRQYLEIVNNRAYGSYKEWHDNGELKVFVKVIGGEADITPSAEKTWLFDGLSHVWDENGQLIAEIPYAHGVLEGTANYYHGNGSIWKKVSYSKGMMEGESHIFLDNGTLLQLTHYVANKKHGSAMRYWNENQTSSIEEYENGLLMTGEYRDLQGNGVAKIVNGSGFKALFGKDKLNELQEYRHGIQEGLITVFSSNGLIARTYHLKNEIKDGEEVTYYEQNQADHPNTPKLAVNYVEGRIQGIVKTWYPNGVLENQREMSGNAKNGLLMAWYKDGSLMLIEEYEQDKLLRGEYYPLGDSTPSSTIVAGNGTATLFDPSGILLKKVAYSNGKPTT